MKSNKAFWGNPLWYVIHKLAAEYVPSPETKAAYTNMMDSFTVLLPCERCRGNLTFKLEKYPLEPHLKSNDSLFRWTYNIHDLVNKHVNEYHPEQPPKVSPDYKSIKKFYFETDTLMGKHIWTVIHMFAATYKPTPEYVRAFKKFMNALTLLMPYPNYRHNLKYIMTKYPMDSYLNDNHNLFFWTYFIHDLINLNISRSGRNKVSPCYDRIKKYYFDAMGEECGECKVGK
jgi:hypothetical protein